MLPPRTQATLLLTGHFADGAAPLDVREWNRLARWLADRGLAPEDLLQGDIDDLLTGWDDARIGRDRLLALLDRGATLALAVERWLGTGMWMLGRSDAAYPARLKQHLRDSAPPLLFGYGQGRHFGNRGVAIVGSRNAAEHDLRMAETLGRLTAEAGCNVVSGGARGIDDRAAAGAFAAGGTVIAVVADSLLRNAGKKQYRDHLLREDLVLVTPYSPDAGFSAGNAMGRNRLIYCLGDTSIAVSSANGTGGTWGGAIQNLKHGWVPLWVAPTDDPASGNPALVEQGAGWLPGADSLEIEALFAWPAGAHNAQPTQGALF